MQKVYQIQGIVDVSFRHFFLNGYEGAPFYDSHIFVDNMAACHERLLALFTVKTRLDEYKTSIDIDALLTLHHLPITLKKIHTLSIVEIQSGDFISRDLSITLHHGKPELTKRNSHTSD